MLMNRLDCGDRIDCIVIITLSHRHDHAEWIVMITLLHRHDQTACTPHDQTDVNASYASWPKSTKITSPTDVLADRTVLTAIRAASSNGQP